MVIATETTSSLNRAVSRHTDASTANAAVTLTTPTGRPVRLLGVFVKYSAAPTQTGVTVEIDSGAGAAYDTTISTGSANVQNNQYIPTQELIISATDAIRVTAPAAGGAVTGQISVYTEAIG
jgi:hypothetical protein